MRVNNVVGLTNAITGRNFAFSRKLKENEKKDYTASINEAMDYLGIQNRAMIIHGASFPARKGMDADTGIGSPYNNKEFIDFLKLHGFNGIQLGPTGKLNRGDTSPYSSSVFAKNPLFIDFTLLKDKKYASILPEGYAYVALNRIKPEKENYTRADYKEAEENVKELAKVAYDNFKEKVEAQDDDALKLKAEFDDFTEKNAFWLDYYAVLDSVANKYGTDFYPKWQEDDRNLIQNVKKGDEYAISYYEQLKNHNAKDIELYKFTQFLIDKQSKEDDKTREDFTYISDLLVGVSSFDEMIFKDVFLEDWKIGARDGGVLNSPQLWNIPVVNPNKLFNRDGSLGPAGEFIKLKIKKAVQDASNIRVDHAFGLVDPFIYKESSVHKISGNDNGKRVEVPDVKKLKSGNLSQLGIDRRHNYLRIVPDIVLPALKECGVDPKTAVWEDLGYDATGLYDKICRHELGLPGIDVLLWSRGENANKNNWAYVGCHDNEPLRMGIESGRAMKDREYAWNKDYLAWYVKPGYDNDHIRPSYKRRIENNHKELLKAKFIELLRSTKNIQISFMDFFGINKRFNTPGTVGEDNWTLRMAPDWEDKYYKNLENSESRNNWALNMPELLSAAVKAKADFDIAQKEYAIESSIPRYQKDKIHSEANKIISKLDKYSEILKEKEA